MIRISTLTMKIIYFVSMMQNGALAEAIRIWKNNFDKEFEGVEECPICYSVIHTANHSFLTLLASTSSIQPVSISGSQLLTNHLAPCASLHSDLVINLESKSQ